jgi:hypothetical protein
MIDISDSQIKNFNRCQRRWAYEKVLGLSSEEDKENMQLGDAFHKGMEKYVETQGNLPAAILESQTAVKNTWKDFEVPGWAFVVVPAMVEGAIRHWLPVFLQTYTYDAVETWVEYTPHPAVKTRMYVDIYARKNTSRKLCVFDYKTTGSQGGGDVSKGLAFNRQLALYSIATYRTRGEWPEDVGLIFAQKPKKEDPIAAAKQAKDDPNLYYSRIQTVTPAFAQYAISLEHSDVMTALHMSAIKDNVKANGPIALDNVPANFEGCSKYNSMCGFSAGCHCGQPIHQTMRKV